MANVSTYGTFTHAIVRGIPETFGQHAGEGRQNGDTSVDLAKAQRQFGCLTGALRQKVGLQLIEIPPDPELPDSWRIEDVAIIQGNTALITRPFKQQRRSEVMATPGHFSHVQMLSQIPIFSPFILKPDGSFVVLTVTNHMKFIFFAKHIETTRGR